MLLNNELDLSFPVGFHHMNGEEKSKMEFMAAGSGECFFNPEKQMVVSVGWQELTGFAPLTLKTGDAEKMMERVIRDAMAPFQYRFDEPLEKQLAGRAAEGFRYRYEAQGIGMSGETYVVKNKKTLYDLHFYYRTELSKESEAAVDGILAGASWA